MWWTQDGGQHWDNKTPRPVSPDETLTVQGVSANVAWAAVASSREPLFPVWVTGTHGDHWSRASSLPANDGVPFMSALSGRQAWAATNLVGASGSESMVLDRTENGGKTWAMLSSSVTAKMATHPNEQSTSRHPIPLDGNKSGMVFASPDEGFISGGQTGTNAQSAALWRTIDGGNNWFPVAISARPAELLNWALAPTFFDAQDGVMAVEVNTWELATYRTHNGGKTWSEGSLLPFSTKMGGPFWSYATENSGLYVAIKANAQGAIMESKLYETSNGGHSFEPLLGPCRYGISRRWMMCRPPSRSP